MKTDYKEILNRISQELTSVNFDSLIDYNHKNIIIEVATIAMEEVEKNSIDAIQELETSLHLSETSNKHLNKDIIEINEKLLFYMNKLGAKPSERFLPNMDLAQNVAYIMDLYDISCPLEHPQAVIDINALISTGADAITETKRLSNTPQEETKYHPTPIQEVDSILSRLEDHLHGKSGTDVTIARKILSELPMYIVDRPQVSEQERLNTRPYTNINTGLWKDDKVFEDFEKSVNNKRKQSKEDKESCKCQRCGNRYNIDLIIPDDLWVNISPQKVDGFKSGGLLCGSCIMEELEVEIGKSDYFYISKNKPISTAPNNKVEQPTPIQKFIMAEKELEKTTGSIFEEQPKPDISKLRERSKIIDLLESYSKFLQESGYIDTDWNTEEPFAIDTFLKEINLKEE